MQDLFICNASITSAVILLLFITISQSFCHEKVFPKKHFWHFCPFSARPFGTGSLQTFSFFSHILHPFDCKSKLRMKVPKYNCDFHFWVVNVIMKFSSRQWSYDKAHRTGCLVGKNWTPHMNIKSWQYSKSINRGKNHRWNVKWCISNLLAA